MSLGAPNLLWNSSQSPLREFQIFLQGGYWRAVLCAFAEGRITAQEGHIRGLAHSHLFPFLLLPLCLSLFDPQSVSSLQDQSNAVNVAVNEINSGRHEEALLLLDDVIANARRPNFAAHLVRGTGRALRRELKGIVPSGFVGFSVARWHRAARRLIGFDDLCPALHWSFHVSCVAVTLPSYFYPLQLYRALIKCLSNLGLHVS